MRELVTLIWVVLAIATTVVISIANAIWLVIAIPVAIILLLVFGVLARIFDRD